jgi:tetratricopeptide (TPR) repeat protein
MLVVEDEPLGGKAMDRKHRAGRNKMPASDPTASASHYVRAAERYLILGKFDQALEQLGFAQRLEPENQYILAVLERAQLLQNRGKMKDSGENTSLSGTDGSGPRYLSVTVGKEFEQGIKATREEPMLSGQEIRLRVRQLVANADALLSRGLSESAFESLMKAYLLDPLAPEVLSCEGRVLPAWEMTRNARGQEVFSRSGTVAVQAQGDPGRIEALKKQKEAERLEREREMWREASSAPRTGGSSQAPRVTPDTAQGKAKGSTSGRRWKLF